MRTEAKIPLNKVIPAYTKGVNWSFLAHSPFPGWDPYTPPVPNGRIYPSRERPGESPATRVREPWGVEAAAEDPEAPERVSAPKAMGGVQFWEGGQVSEAVGGGSTPEQTLPCSS